MKRQMIVRAFAFVLASGCVSAQDIPMIRASVNCWKRGAVQTLAASFLITPAPPGEFQPWRRTVGIYDSESGVGWVYRAYSAIVMSKDELVKTLDLHFACSDAVIVAFDTPGWTVEMASGADRYSTQAALEEALRTASALPRAQYYPRGGPFQEIQLPESREVRFFIDRLPGETLHSTDRPDQAQVTSARIDGDMVFVTLTKPISGRSIEVAFDWRRKTHGPQRRLSPETEAEKRYKSIDRRREKQ